MTPYRSRIYRQRIGPTIQYFPKGDELFELVFDRDFHIHCDFTFDCFEDKIWSSTCTSDIRLARDNETVTLNKSRLFRHTSTFEDIPVPL